jgi:ATP-dependent Clp protease ATP-binding subunit ClpB
MNECIVFYPLGKAHIREIADIQISDLRKRLYEQDMNLVISVAALDLLGEAGFDPVNGARLLKRAIQYQLENPLV